MGSENLKILFKILESYILLDFQGFLSTNFDSILSGMEALFEDFGDDCLVLLAKFANAFLTSAVANNLNILPNSMNSLLFAIFKHFGQKPGTVLRSMMYSVAGRVMLQFPDSMKIIGEKLGMNISNFMVTWCNDMDSITHHDRRKISSMAQLGKNKMFFRMKILYQLERL